MFEGIPQPILDFVQKENSNYYNHNYGLRQEHFEKNEKLK